MFCSCFNYINCLSFSQNINHYCSQKDVPPKKVPEVDQGNQETKKLQIPGVCAGGGGGKGGTKNLFVLIVHVVYRT